MFEVKLLRVFEQLLHNYNNQAGIAHVRHLFNKKIPDRDVPRISCYNLNENQTIFVEIANLLNNK